MYTNIPGKMLIIRKCNASDVVWIFPGIQYTYVYTLMVMLQTCTLRLCFTSRTSFRKVVNGHVYKQKVTNSSTHGTECSYVLTYRMVWFYVYYHSGFTTTFFSLFFWLLCPGGVSLFRKGPYKKGWHLSWGSTYPAFPANIQKRGDVYYGVLYRHLGILRSYFNMHTEYLHAWDTVIVFVIYFRPL